MSSANDALAFRAFESPDASACARIYRDAVLKVGATAYNAIQVAMWSSFANEPDFAAGLARGNCIVATREETIAGFGQLEPIDHVHLLYVTPEFARRGIGAALLARLEARAAEQGVARLTTNASHLSRPVFARAGWQVDEIEITERNGVHFERFNMSKRLDPVSGSRT